MKKLLFLYLVVISSICLIGEVQADWREDIKLLSAEVKGATLYSVRENQVEAGMGLELASYKEKLELDFLFAPPKQTLALGLSYEASILEPILSNVFQINLPDKFKGNITQSLGMYRGWSNVGTTEIYDDWGIYATALRYSW